MVSQSLHHSGLELKLWNMEEFAEGRIKMKLWQTSVRILQVEYITLKLDLLYQFFITLEGEYSTDLS